MKLSLNLSEREFKEHYFLKEELVNFCCENGLSNKGSKEELTNRVVLFLRDGTIINDYQKKTMKKIIEQEIELDLVIENDFVCSEKHRAFFKEHIGKSFTFKVAFQEWLKENAGKKTYQDAVDVYYQLLEKPKKIAKQFEYNQYIKDFFADNKGLTLQDAIRCWTYKRDQRGSNKYSSDDLNVLKSVIKK